jgi:hypothetical protein
VSFFCPSLHRDRCRGSVRSLKGSRTVIRRLGGSSEGQAVTLPEMHLGDKRLELVPALILNGGGKTESVRDGVIGPKSLGFRAVQFNFRRHRMGFDD